MPALLDPTQIFARATLRITVASALVAGWLAPLILGAVLPLERTLFSIVPAAALGAFAVYQSHRRVGAVLAWSTLAGVVYLMVALVLQSDPSRSVTPESMLLLGLLGSIASGPTGFLFGLVFLIGLAGQPEARRAPTQDTPAQAAFSSARMLLVAGGLASIAALPQWHVYWRFFAPQMAPPWMRMLAGSAPLLCAALVLLFIGIREKWMNRRLRETIVRGEHHEYYPGEIAPEGDAMALTERDKVALEKRALCRRTSQSAYRGEGPLPLYVANNPDQAGHVS